MDSTAFIMVHNPWSSVQGDADELRKEAKTLDQFKAALVSIYRSKFDVDSEGMNRLMDEETWWTGDEALEVGFACTVIPTTVRAAACATRHHFAKIPDAAAKFLAVRAEPQSPPSEQFAAEEVLPSSFPSDGGSTNSPEQGELSLQAPASPEGEGQVAATASGQQQEWESRLAGLQAAKDRELAEMSAKYKADVADMKARHEAALADLQNQLQAKAQELESAKAEASSLASKLGNAEQALAQTREQLEAEIAQHRKLASAALKQPKEPMRSAAEIARDASLTPAEKSRLLGEGKYTN